jgi:hypothetical protein
MGSTEHLLTAPTPIYWCGLFSFPCGLLSCFWAFTFTSSWSDWSLDLCWSLYACTYLIGERDQSVLCTLLSPGLPYRFTCCCRLIHGCINHLLPWSLNLSIHWSFYGSMCGLSLQCAWCARCRPPLYCPTPYDAVWSINLVVPLIHGLMDHYVLPCDPGSWVLFIIFLPRAYLPSAMLSLTGWSTTKVIIQGESRQQTQNSKGDWLLLHHCSCALTRRTMAGVMPLWCKGPAPVDL